MSLILDALRKSEAERQRGRAPDLFAPIADNVAPPAKPPLAFWVLAIVIVLIIAAVLLWPTPQQHISTTDDETAGANGNSETVAAPIAMQPEIPAPPPPIVVASGPGKRKTSEPDATAPEKATPDLQATVAPAAIDAATALEADSAPSPAAASAAPATDAGPALPSLATLDSTTRAALPPLQLSMHVWNEDASRRFAIIDGQRLGEGGKLAGVVVSEIRRDGVVLDIAGRQFLLPRP